MENEEEYNPKKYSIKLSGTVKKRKTDETSQYSEENVRESRVSNYFKQRTTSIDSLPPLSSEEEESETPKKKKHSQKKKHESNEVILNNFVLFKEIANGTFGKIIYGFNIRDNVEVAIKQEVLFEERSQLKLEGKIYNTLLNIPKNYDITGIHPIPQDEVIGVPKFFGIGKHKNNNYLILEFLGPNLGQLFKFCNNKKFTIITVFLIAIQILNRIENLHKYHYIHRDIKPENFVIGTGDKSNIIYLIDFGLSKRYKDKATGQHIPYRENKDLVGTVRYASINAHLGIEQSRRDDIEGIGYVLVYFYLGRLPWQGKQDKGKPQVSKIMEKKLITPPEILCKKMPVEFSYYFHYCRNLKFEDRPDYNMIKGLFLELLSSRVNLKEEILFDWFDENSSYKEKKRLELNWAESGRAGDMKEDKRMKNGMNLIEEKDESKEESNIHNIINNKNDGIANKQKDILEDLLKGDHKDIEEKHEHDQEGDKIIEEKNSKGSSSYKVVNKEE